MIMVSMPLMSGNTLTLVSATAAIISQAAEHHLLNGSSRMQRN